MKIILVDNTNELKCKISIFLVFTSNIKLEAKAIEINCPKSLLKAKNAEANP